MKNILTIIKKELTRFFTDKRMMLLLIMPGFLIFMVYSLLGGVVNSEMEKEKAETYVIYTVNCPAEFAALDLKELSGFNITASATTADKVDELKTQITEDKIQLIIVYEENFIQKISEYKVSSGEKAPQVEMFYDSSKTKSQTMFEYYSAALNAFEAQSSNMFDINNNANVSFDLADNAGDALTIQIVTAILPYLLLVFLFTGCMSITPESIAGEKERGTIATLLVSPVKRSHIAIGKIAALSIVSLISAISSLLGTLLSLPNMMQGMDINISMYNAATYITLFGVVVVTELFFNIILGIVSTYARNVKEASALSAPVMVLVMLVAVTTITGNSADVPVWNFFVPILNSARCITEIFSLKFNALHFAFTLLSNAAFVALGVFALTKMFNSEKIMFKQ